MIGLFARRPSFGNAVLPLDETGEHLDEATFRQTLRYMADGGTSVFVGGPHATEFVNMNPKERRTIWAIAVDELAGDVAAIVLGPGSTTELIGQFRLAADLGFAAAQLYPGAQDAHGNDGLFVREADRYFRDVLEATDLPMFLCGYHGGVIIDSSNQQVPYELLLQLLHDYPHIAGVTVDGSQPLGHLAEFVHAVGERCPVRVASAIDWIAVLDTGVYGFHSIQPSVAPRLCSRMLAAYHAGNRAEAGELAAVIRALNEAIHAPGFYYPRSIKPMLRHLGFSMGSIRRPYLPPPAEVQREMAARLDALALGRFEELPAAQ